MPIFILTLFFILQIVPFVTSSPLTGKASAVTSNNLNFQGRLLTNTGGLVPDGSYNIQFNLYTVASGGTSEWTESRLNSASQGVVVKNGYFSVYLGSITAFTASIDWDQEHWLGMTVRGTGSCVFGSCTPTDAEMTPRFKLTSVPYAFRAGAITDSAGDVFTADDLIKKSPSSVQGVNSAVAAIRLNQTGSGSLLQLQGDGSDVFTVDKSGNAVLASGITIGNSSSTIAGTIRWNGTNFQGYNGSSWSSFGGSVTPFVSKTKTANEIQNNVVNPTATLQADDQLFFPVGANETWNYRFVLQISGNATPDIKFSVTAPTGATCVTGVSEAENAMAIGNLGCGVSSGIVPMSTATDVFEVVGSVTNGSTAGNLTLNWAQNTANAANVTVLAGSFVEASRSLGGSSADVAFIQDGNSFGGLAVLGTNDAYGLSFETNNTERLRILDSGEIRANDDLIANTVATGTTGTTTGMGTNTTTLNLISDAFAVNDVVLIDNAGQDYYTRITVDPGTGSYTVSPAVTFETGRTVTKYTVQNIGASTTDYSSQVNRFFQGYFLGGVVIGAGTTIISDGAINSTTTLEIQSGGGDVSIGGGLSITGVISGDASGLTNIDGSSVDGATLIDINAGNIATGTLADGRLSTNVVLLSGTQTFSGTKTFSSGLTISGGDIGAGSANITTTGQISGATIVGDGAGLSNLDANDIASGTLSDSRLSTNVALLSGTQTFTGSKTFGAGLTISGGNVDGGSANVITTGQISGATIVGDGSSLTSLNATNLSSGTIADGRLSTNVATLSGSQTFTGAKTFSGGFVLGLSTITSSATVSRAVGLPDEAGTVCLSNTNTCGYLRLASGSAQTDSSNNDVLFVNKTSATGNLINLQRSGGAVFTVANSGALQIQATSSTALDIRNAGGTSYFSIDTNTGIVRVGGVAADAIGVLFVLDSKNTLPDPTGQLGAMYFNTTRKTFRCYEDERGWIDCLGQSKPNTRRSTRFMASGTATSITADGGDIATVVGTGSASAATTTNSPAVNYATNNAVNSDSGISGNLNYNSSANAGLQANVRLVSTASTRNWIGFTNQTLATMNGGSNPVGNYAAFRYDTSVSGETTWKCVTKNGTTQLVNDSGITVGTTFIKMDILINATSVVFKINGSVVCTNTSSLPTGSTMMRHVISRRNLVVGIQSMQVAWLFLESDQ